LNKNELFSESFVKGLRWLNKKTPFRALTKNSKFVSQHMQTARACLWLQIGALHYLVRGEFLTFGFLIIINI